MVYTSVDTNWSNNADVNNKLKFSFCYSSLLGRIHFNANLSTFLDINNIQESNNAFTSCFNRSMSLTTIPHIISGLRVS